MNDLMTKSFLNYVDLKKQAKMDVDIEIGELDPSGQSTLSKFFEEVDAIRSDMEELKYLLIDLQELNKEAQLAQSSKILRGLRDRINSDMVMVMRKAKAIKKRLEMVEKSDVGNGTHLDRTRIAVTNGLRAKLKEILNDFQILRERVISDHKEVLKRTYYCTMGKQPSEEMIENMMSQGGLVAIFDGKREVMEENQERHEAVEAIKKSLVQLHQIFLDMDVMIETQGDQMNNIEQHVLDAGVYVNEGTKELDRAQRMKKRRMWACWIGVLVLVIILMCLIAILF